MVRRHVSSAEGVGLNRKVVGNPEINHAAPERTLQASAFLMEELWWEPSMTVTSCPTCHLRASQRWRRSKVAQTTSVTDLARRQPERGDSIPRGRQVLASVSYPFPACAEGLGRARVQQVKKPMREEQVNNVTDEQVMEWS